MPPRGRRFGRRRRPRPALTAAATKATRRADPRSAGTRSSPPRPAARGRSQGRGHAEGSQSVRRMAPAEGFDRRWEHEAGRAGYAARRRRAGCARGCAAGPAVDRPRQGSPPHSPCPRSPCVGRRRCPRRDVGAPRASRPAGPCRGPGRCEQFGVGPQRPGLQPRKPGGPDDVPGQGEHERSEHPIGHALRAQHHQHAGDRRRAGDKHHVRGVGSPHLPRVGVALPSPRRPHGGHRILRVVSRPGAWRRTRAPGRRS